MFAVQAQLRAPWLADADTTATIGLQITAKAAPDTAERGHGQRTFMPALSNLAVRDVETLVHPYVNLARLRETGPLVIERGRGVYVY